jgi:hypothetical protein
VNGKTLAASEPAIPCGLVAKSVFNDTFWFYNVSNGNSVNITIDDTNIAWESDVEYKFANVDECPDGSSWENC